MFLHPAPIDDAVAKAFKDAQREDGYVENHTRLWAWRLDLRDAFIELRKLLTSMSALSEREIIVIVCATASALNDAYCSMAWAVRLAQMTDPATAASILRGLGAAPLTEREHALADWARKVTRAPNDTSAADVEGLRKAGLTDREIFEATLYAGFRIAFSTVNDALGATPDRQLAAEAPAEVRAAITYGRLVAD